MFNKLNTNNQTIKNNNNSNSNYMRTKTITLIVTKIIICNNSKLAKVAQLVMQNSEWIMYSHLA